jgi:hypothetical protein
MQNSSDRITRDTVISLLQHQEERAISIFLTTQRSGPDIQQNPIRFKNLLTRAEEQAEALGMRDRKMEKLFEPAKKLIEETPFWQHQSDGLAVFLTQNMFQTYRVPLSFEPVAVVADSFHLKPLFPLFTENAAFYILALSQKQVYLLQASHYDVRQVEVEGLPDSLEAMLAAEEREKEVQAHSAARIRGSKNKEAAAFHGQGAGTDEANAKRLQFFYQVDKAVHQYLQGRHSPLILAGVEALFPLYRQANTYPHVLEQGIRGNPEKLRPEELHEQALEIVRPLLLKNRQEAAARYQQLASSDNGKTSQRVREIVAAAYYGRIATLFVAVGVQQWGTFDAQTNTAHLHDEQAPGDHDLLNTAAVQTLLHGGTVYAVEPDAVPAPALAAAIFRH